MNGLTGKREVNMIAAWKKTNHSSAGGANFLALLLWLYFSSFHILCRREIPEGIQKRHGG